MSSSTRLFRLLAPVLVLALMLSACGGDDGEESTEAPTEEASADDETADEEDVGDEDVAEDGDEDVAEDMASEAPADDASDADDTADGADGDAAGPPQEIPELTLPEDTSAPGALTIVDGGDEQVIDGLAACGFDGGTFMLTDGRTAMQVSYLTAAFGSRAIDATLAFEDTTYRVQTHLDTEHGLTPGGDAVQGESTVTSADGESLVARWSFDASEVPPCAGLQALVPNPGEGIESGIDPDSRELGTVVLGERTLTVTGGCTTDGGDESTFQLELDDPAGGEGSADITHLYRSSQTGMTITDGTGTTYTGNTPEGGPAVQDPGALFTGSAFIFSESGEAASVEFDVFLAGLPAC